jgi:hypothetical protein
MLKNINSALIMSNRIKFRNGRRIPKLIIRTIKTISVTMLINITAKEKVY